MSMPGRVGAPVRFPKAAATIIRRSDTQVASGFVTAKLIGVSRRILNRVSEIVYARMQRVARLCNGSTRDFGSLCLGSNPSRALIYIGYCSAE